MAIQSLPAVASDYAREQRAENGAAVAAMGRLWRRMGDDFDTSFLAIAPDLIEVTNTAQARISRQAQEYIPAILEATDQAGADRPRLEIDERAYVGTAGDGRPTEAVLYGAVTEAKKQVRSGASTSVALHRAGEWLSTAAGTILSDTHRGMEGFESYARPVSGWVRQLTPPSCGRCVILAGKRYRKNQGFARHPGCFPAGAVVSGPAPEAATRRWYEGELAIVRTASGKKLTATANHPVLTDQGWIPAGLLNKGDRVLASTARDGAVPLVVPDEKQAPALIEDVWGADNMVPLGAVPTAAEDFHGDGGHGDVDVVLPNRLLGHGAQASIGQGVVDRLFAGGLYAPAALTGLGALDELIPGQANAGGREMGGGGLGLAFSGGHLGGADFSGLGLASDFATAVYEMAPNDVAADIESLGEFILTGTGLIVPREGLGIERDVTSRWDAPAGPLTMETRGAYASRGQDLGLRLSGQVEPDRVVDVSLVKWSGHVYNLTSSEGWYAADGLIVSNCDCVHIPAAENIAGDMTTSVGEYLGSLDEDGLAKALGSKANARAYTEFDADPYQIVNSYRSGISKAQQYGRNVTYTTEGTTVRGVAGQQMRRVRALSAMSRLPGSNYRRLTTPRLMPESILSLNLSQARTEQMLRDFGWIVR